MEALRKIEKSTTYCTIKGAWIHNGELIVQSTVDDALVAIARFDTVGEEKSEPKERKPRKSKNGLAEPVLRGYQPEGEEPGTPSPPRQP